MSQWQPPPQYGNMPSRNPHEAQPWQVQYQQQVPKKHSGVGIASSILSLLAIICFVGVFVFVWFMESRNPGQLDKDSSPELMMLGLIFLAAIGLALVGGILGVVGLFAADRNRLYAVLGLSFNALIVLGSIGLMILGALV